MSQTQGKGSAAGPGGAHAAEPGSGTDAHGNGHTDIGVEPDRIPTKMLSIWVAVTTLLVIVLVVGVVQLFNSWGSREVDDKESVDAGEIQGMRAVDQDRLAHIDDAMSLLVAQPDRLGPVALPGDVEGSGAGTGQPAPTEGGVAPPTTPEPTLPAEAPPTPAPTTVAPTTLVAPTEGTGQTTLATPTPTAPTEGTGQIARAIPTAPAEGTGQVAAEGTGQAAAEGTGQAAAEGTGQTLAEGTGQPAPPEGTGSSAHP